MTNPDREPEAHLVIAGTGRAGTSFLVRYLTELGLDTHLGRHGEKDSWDESANAGLETVPLPNQTWDLPYVVKYPWLYQCIDHILVSGTMRLDGVIIPVRDLVEAATSRTLVELQAMHRSLPWMAEMDQSWEVWGSTPGGVTYSLNPLDQGRLLAVGFHHLVERLVRADIPVVLLAFPLLIEDPHYLFRKLRPFLPETVCEDAAVAAHMHLSDLAKVRVRSELDAAARSDAPSRGDFTHYASHDGLDAIAVRRELARLRRLLAGAEASARQAENLTTEAQAIAASANAEAATARQQARMAQEQATKACEETRMACEETRMACEETRMAKEAVARAMKELQAESAQRERDTAHLCEQLSEARREATHARHDLAIVYASRSWRLGRPYRVFGAAVQRMRGGVRSPLQESHMQYQPSGPTSLRQSPPVIQPPRAEADPWSRWPIWLGDDSFRTKRFTYRMSLDKLDGVTRDGAVAMLKNRSFVEIYLDLIRELRPHRILEIGFFQGGMPLFLADMLAPEKVVGIDYLPPSDVLTAMIASAGLQDTVRLYGGIMQADTPTLRRIVETEFADRALDLIIDDASHEYENSKGCFEELFGYLRPGGKYVIEDWGWLHWPGEEWQTAKSHFWNKPAMTNLIFELVMTLGSQHPKVIARLEILSWACVVITRGVDLAHGARIDLSATRLTSGRQFHLL